MSKSIVGNLARGINTQGRNRNEALAEQRAHPLVAAPIQFLTESLSSSLVSQTDIQR